MKKSLIKSAIVGVSILALAGVATADVDINLYGASAQYNFWNKFAGTFLTQQMGCTDTPQSAGDGTNGITTATTCGSFGAITIRYTSKASFDGINAAIGQYDPQANDYSKLPACPDNHQRYMAKDLTLATACETVNVGASDVDALSFAQESHGLLLGPLGGAQTDRVFSADTLPTSAVGPFEGKTVVLNGHTKLNGIPIPNPQTPMAYPFAFFVNNNVQSYRCTSVGADAPSNIDGACDPNDAKSCGTGGVCEEKTIDNLSRLQAVALFSGSVGDWSDFGPAFPALPVTLCYRHAGSGTHCTLDLGVMEGNGWGAGMQTLEAPADPANINYTGSYPYIYFNDGTGDLVKCMQFVAGDTKDGNGNTMADYDSAAVGGAVGYMDGDHAAPSSSTGPIKYEGVAVNRNTIENGLYDAFFTSNRLYIDTTKLSSDQQEVYYRMLEYLTPANVDQVSVDFAATSQLKFLKGSAQHIKDSKYPTYQP